jgi:hypothetical protein
MNSDGTEESKWGDGAQSMEEIMTARMDTSVSGIRPFMGSARAPPVLGVGMGVGEAVESGSLKVIETLNVGVGASSEFDVVEVALVVDDPEVVGTPAALFAGSFKAFNASTTPRS